MSRLDRVGYGFDASPLAYADRETGALLTTPPRPIMAVHRFYETSDHQLGHDIDGVHRATVPPEGMHDYARTWPQCADLVADLLTPPAPADVEQAADPQ